MFSYKTATILVILILLSACHSKTEKPLPSVSVDSLIRNGQSSVELSLRQPLLINSKTTSQWRLELGRKDEKFAEFNFNEKQVQGSVQFTKPGEYVMTVYSVASSNAPNIMKQTITAIVR